MDCEDEEGHLTKFDSPILDKEAAIMDEVIALCKEMEANYEQRLHQNE